MSSHVVDGAAIDVPTIEHVLIAGVQEHACSRPIDVNVGLGVESSVIHI